MVHVFDVSILTCVWKSKDSASVRSPYVTCCGIDYESLADNPPMKLELEEYK